MKKAVSLVLICVLSLCLVLSGCDAGGLSGVFNTGAKKEFTIDLSQGEYREGGEDGGIGDVLHTYWFNYAIEEAYTCKTYGDYTAPSDCLLLVVRMGIKNTSGSRLPMSDIDFWVWWNDDAEDAYALPLTTSEDADDDQVYVDHVLSDDMFPATYELGIRETRVGDLIFQVPDKDMDGRDNLDFMFLFLEVFDTEETGDSYYIDFTAQQR